MTPEQLRRIADSIAGHPPCDKCGSYQMIQGVHKCVSRKQPLVNGGRTTEGGYIRIYRPEHPRADRRRYVPEHVLVAEAALGYFLPRPTEVHHFNEVRTDNANTNLVICENRSYHRLLHVRQRIVKAGGDPNTQKLCSHCKIPKDFNQFGSDCSQYDNLYGDCLTCTRASDQLRNARRYRARVKV